MFDRLLKPSQKHHYFLFGARGTGKSTFFLKQFFEGLKPEQYFYVDLLDPEIEERLLSKPSLLFEWIDALPKQPQWIVLDEIQKVPKLLDLIHQQHGKNSYRFILSGSSARKLKLKGADLLAGRAFQYQLFPLHSLELGKAFSLATYLEYGGLPAIYLMDSDEDRAKFLKSYVLLYLKMEIQMEQVVRKLDPFRNFLEVAAQMNGKILNFSTLAREVHADIKTVQSYYQILVDTWLGFILPAYSSSVRKSQSQAPKFYFIDTGIKRALEHALQMKPVAGTSYYGECFEHFVILEIYKLNHYLEKDFQLSYLRNYDGNEIDLVLKRAKEIILIEIKSTTKVDSHDLKFLERTAVEWGAKAYCLSQDSIQRKVGTVLCLPWQKGINKIFE